MVRLREGRMDSNVMFCLTVLIFSTFAVVFSRVPPSRNQIHHPNVLTRPPTILKSATGRPRNRNTWNKSKTSSAPTEVDDDYITTTSGYGNYGQQGGFGYDMNGYNTATSYYDYGTGSNGGTSWEYDDDYVTTAVSTSFTSNTRYNTWNRPAPRYRNTIPKPTTTIATTTTTTTTPEPPEVEEKNSLSNSLFGSSSGLGGSGYCFCSPLKSCPGRSIPRRGLCVNFITYFTKIRLIRCCYSPSLSKRML